MSARRALCTGAAGQDGSYLCEQLLHRGYFVTAMVRDRQRGEEVLGGLLAAHPGQFLLVTGDLNDYGSLAMAVELAAPDEIYHLAGLSSIPQASVLPDLVLQTNAIGSYRILHLAHQHNIDTRVFVACSAEIFGDTMEAPQTLSTPLAPRNVYGLSKLAAHHAVELARRRGQFAVSGVMFPHESPRRSPAFVTRKVTMAAARINCGRQKKLELGHLEVYRDWGYAPEYTDCMWRMLQQDKPQDQIIATGILHSLRDLCRIAFQEVGLNYQDHVVIDPTLNRPDRGLALQGSTERAWETLRWQAEKEFEEIVLEMVRHDRVLLGDRGG